MKKNRTIVSVTLIIVLQWVSYLPGRAQSLDSLLSAYETVQNTGERISLMLNLASIFQSRQAYNKAIEYYSGILNMEQAEANYDEVAILKNMAFCYAQLIDYENEIVVFNRLLEMERIKFNNEEKVKILQNLSDVYVKLKKYREAVKVNLTIIDIAEQEQNRLWATVALNNLGFIYNALGDTNSSIMYFNKGYELVKSESIQLSDESRAAILINMGVSNAGIGRMIQAQKFLNEALELRKKGNDPIKIAQILNYLAAYDLINDMPDKAMGKANQAIALLEPLENSDEVDNTLVNSYKVMTEIMLRKVRINDFKEYYKKYSVLQDEIIERGRKSNRLLLDHQLNVEKQAYEIRLLLAEKEKERERQTFELKQSQMERERSESELKIKLNEIELLKHQQELQNIHFRNQQLEKERVEQMLVLTRQRSEATEQQQLIEILQKDKELQDLQIAKRQNEIELLEKERELSGKNIIIARVIIIFLLLMLILVISMIRYRIKKNKLLAQQNTTINNMNSEILAQNDELTAINEKLNESSLQLKNQNNKLIEAQETIHKQNQKLKSYNKDLELEVGKRTGELEKSNQQLMQYNKKLEQFTYAISHNIRAPIARLLGLVDMLNKLENAEEKEYVLQMIQKSSFDLDEVVNDLHNILEIKSNAQSFPERIDLARSWELAIVELQEDINDADAVLNTDFAELAQITLSGNYFENIFKQLISNSLKFKAKNRDCVINVEAKRTDGIATIIYSDNGTGIDMEKFGHQVFGLYKRFNLTEAGKGIGLYIVKSQVESMGGTIEVESSPNKGVTFKMEFPIDDLEIA